MNIWCFKTIINGRNWWHLWCNKNNILSLKIIWREKINESSENKEESRRMALYRHANMGDHVSIV
jgi:hypothetical protein